jgi:hypothetical protein
MSQVRRAYIATTNHTPCTPTVAAAHPRRAGPCPPLAGRALALLSTQVQAPPRFRVSLHLHALTRSRFRGGGAAAQEGSGPAAVPAPAARPAELEGLGEPGAKQQPPGARSCRVPCVSRARTASVLLLLPPLPPPRLVLLLLLLLLRLRLLHPLPAPGCGARQWPAKHARTQDPDVAHRQRQQRLRLRLRRCARGGKVQHDRLGHGVAGHRLRRNRNRDRGRAPRCPRRDAANAARGAPHGLQGLRLPRHWPGWWAF